MDRSLRRATELVRNQTAAALDAALESALPLAKAFVKTTRENHPGITPAEAMRRLEWWYRSTVTSTGAAAGLTAFAPNPVAWAATAAEAGLFLTSSAVFVIAAAEIHGLEDLDPLQRRVLVLSILIGDAGAGGLMKAGPRTSRHWAKLLVKKIPMARIDAANKVLGPRFITKYGTKQGVLVLGREVPLGIGAVIGGTGNALLGELTVRTARKVFGPARKSWDAMGVEVDGDDEVVDAEIVDDEPSA